MSYITLMGYRFLSNKASVVCRHIMSGSEIVAVAHHSDGGLQFLCEKETHTPEEAIVIDLADVVEAHPEILQLPDVRFGWAAVKKDAGWVVELLSDE